MRRPRSRLILHWRGSGKNSQHAKNSLAEFATLYLVTEAAGQSQATLDAKRRDLQRFLSFYQGPYIYRPDRPVEGRYTPVFSSCVTIEQTSTRRFQVRSVEAWGRKPLLATRPLIGPLPAPMPRSPSRRAAGETTGQRVAAAVIEVDVLPSERQRKIANESRGHFISYY